jgi:hypothetical protein
MQVLGEIRATLYSADGSQPDVSTSATVDGPESVARFVRDAVALAERERPASMLLERSIELEPRPSHTREDLAEFRFGSPAGVGLDAARASWLRWYLRAFPASLDERPAGPLALFTGVVLANIEQPGERTWNGGLGGEVLVPWLTGYDGQVEPLWISAAQDPPRSEWVAADAVDRALLLNRLRSELEPLGLRAEPLPVAAPLYVLPLLAHPDSARLEVGADRFQDALALARRHTARPADELDPAALQELELAWLGVAGFDDGEGDRRALVRLEPPGLVLFSSDPEVGAALVRAAEV